MKLQTLGLFAALFLAVPAAWADVPPDNSEGCVDLVAGDACKTDDGKDGGCVKQTCERTILNGTELYDCLICKEGAQPGGKGCATGPAGAASTLGLGAALIAVAFLGALGGRRSVKRAPRASGR